MTKMARLRVKIKSKDMVKPSSPTPNHLKTLQLSSIDQYANPVWMPFIFYYNQTSSVNQNRSTLLKHSLSETLVQFYPLAGRIVGNLSIDCNDQGVVFYEASVLSSLVQVIENPNNPEELIRLLPFPPLNNNNNKTNKGIIVGVQVNRFSCGGMAVGVSLSHKIADGSTFAAFLNTWAKKARGDSNNNHNAAPQVIFDSASLFPQIEFNESYDLEGSICKEKIVTRRIVFDKERLDVLKKRCGKGATRVEAVSAFLWKLFIKASRTKPKAPRIFVAYHTVSLKKIKSSPIPGNYYGNLFWTTFTYAPVGTETEYPEAVAKLRATVKQIDKTFIGKIQTGVAFEESQKVYESFSEEKVEFCGFSDVSKFRFYEVNFGWGTPIWVSMTTLPYKNTVFLMSTKCGEGIEAWVNVPEQDVAALELDREFLSLAFHNVQAKL